MIQVRKEHVGEVLNLFFEHKFIPSTKTGLSAVQEVGVVSDNNQLIIRDDQTVWFDNNILDLQQTWQQTSHQIQHLRDNPECADSEFALLADNTKSALFADLTFDLKKISPHRLSTAAPNPKSPYCASKA